LFNNQNWDIKECESNASAITKLKGSIDDACNLSKDSIEKLIESKVEKLWESYFQKINAQISNLKSDMINVQKQLGLKILSNWNVMSPEKYNFNAHIKHKGSKINKKSPEISKMLSRNEGFNFNKFRKYSTNNKNFDIIKSSSKIPPQVSWAYFSLNNSISSSDKTDVNNSKDIAKKIKLPIFSSNSSKKSFDAFLNRKPKRTSIINSKNLK